MSETEIRRYPSGELVEIRRSARRRKTVQARRVAGRTVVMVPVGLSRAEEDRTVLSLLARLAGPPSPVSDAELAERARLLSRRYLAGGARPASIRWVTNQNTRWGSCTPGEGTIRLSHHLRGMPEWVVDAVILHELAHLLVPGHGPGFRELMARYPHADRAKAFLDGVTFASRRADDLGAPAADDDDECGALASGSGPHR